ncbi:MAG: Copper metallo chaperone [Fluviibacter phosphoraccumulans EoVTN8]
MRRFAIATAAFLAAASVYTADAKVGNLNIDDVWAKSGQPGPVPSAAFMEIKNKGTADKLVSANCDCAKATELHNVKMIDGTMKMYKVDAMDVPADGELKLKSGSYHIMLIGLTRPLVAGETVPLKLKFEKAGEVTVNAKIKDKGAHAGH